MMGSWLSELDVQIAWLAFVWCLLLTTQVSHHLYLEVHHVNSPVSQLRSIGHHLHSPPPLSCLCRTLSRKHCCSYHMWSPGSLHAVLWRHTTLQQVQWSKGCCPKPQKRTNGASRNMFTHTEPSWVQSKSNDQTIPSGKRNNKNDTTQGQVLC